MYKFGASNDCRRFLIATNKGGFLGRPYLPAILGMGFVLRVLALLNNASIEMDGIQYAKIGEAFAQGRFGDALNNVFSPGYPLFIGLFHLLVPDLEIAGRMVSVFFGTLLIWLSFSFGKKVLKDSDKALWLSFLVAFHPYLIRYSGEALSESLATFLFTLTVFCFYLGRKENQRFLVALSGLFLALAYLTRPEYVIYYVPLALLLLWRRRVFDSVTFMFPFIILGSLYMLYLHSHTGLWIVSNKALLSPFVSLSASFTNIPLVSLCFFTAISPAFFALSIFGFRKTDAPYRNLLLLLIIFHILSLAFIGHATKRYSVEFVPICLIIAVKGIDVIVQYLSRSVSKRIVYQVLISVIIIASVFQAYTPMHHDRALLKRAGLFLLSHDPGSVIAARLPVAAFYARGTNVDLLPLMEGDITPERLDLILTERRVRYLVVEDALPKEIPCLSSYISKRSSMFAIGDDRTFVRVYRIN